MPAESTRAPEGVWALKQGKVVRSWRRRFLRLTPGGGLAYALGPQAPPKSTVALGAARLFHSLEPGDDALQPSAWPHGREAFAGGARQPEWPLAARANARLALETPQRTYFFCLEDTSEATRAWLAQLQHALGATAGPGGAAADVPAAADALGSLRVTNEAPATTAPGRPTTAAGGAADAQGAAAQTGQSASDPPAARLALDGGHPCGVRASVLHGLLDAAAAAGLARAGATTADVCAQVVLPATAARRCAYAELLPPETLSPATHFVSHAWAGSFAELVAVVDGVVAEEAAAGRPEPAFWVDLAVNNQHDAPELPFSWWCSTFRKSIAAIGKVVLVLAPWNDPRPLRRAWCLWEIFCAAGSGVGTAAEGEGGGQGGEGHNVGEGHTVGEGDNVGGPSPPRAAAAALLQVRLPPSEQAGFERVLLDEMRAALDVLVTVQAERAEAFSQHDRDMIFKAIEASEGGFAAVNAVVKDQLRAWLVSAAVQAAERRLSEADAEGAETLRVAAASPQGPTAAGTDAASAHRRAAAIEGADLFNNVAVTLYDLGDNAAAIRYGQRAISLYRQLVGPGDFRLASALQNVAVVQAAQGQMAEAEAAYCEALELKRAIFGDNHPSTADSYNNLGVLLKETGA